MPIQILLISLAVLLLDQCTKFLVEASLSGDSSLPVISGLFHLTLIRNSGVAFGLFRGYSLPIAVGTSAVLIGLLWSTLKRGEPAGRSLTWSLGLILGGAMGNLIDRIRVGGVIDFLDFRIWPVFNVADACITVGALLMAWTLIRYR